MLPFVAHKGRLLRPVRLALLLFDFAFYLWVASIVRIYLHLLPVLREEGRFLVVIHEIVLVPPGDVLVHYLRWLLVGASATFQAALELALPLRIFIWSLVHRFLAQKRALALLSRTNHLVRRAHVEPEWPRAVHGLVSRRRRLGHSLRTLIDILYGSIFIFLKHIYIINVRNGRVGRGLYVLVLVCFPEMVLWWERDRSVFPITINNHSIFIIFIGHLFWNLGRMSFLKSFPGFSRITWPRPYWYFLV